MMTAAIKWAGRNAWLGWLLCLPIFWIAADWAMDRHPPFAIIGPVIVRNAPPGGTVFFVADVRRDLYRDCSVRFSRHMIDGAGVRFDFATEPRVMTPDGLRAMDILMAGKLCLAVDVPRGANPGKAVHTTELIYICNPLHRWWPIEVSMPLRFVIEAP